jgi:predicted transcriptional regulator
MDALKTTLEIPDAVYRRLKATAASQGRSVKALVNEAIAEKLREPRKAADPPWMAAFGQLRDLRKETRRIQKVIDEEFSRIDPEEWK